MFEPRTWILLFPNTTWCKRFDFHITWYTFTPTAPTPWGEYCVVVGGVWIADLGNKIEKNLILCYTLCVDACVSAKTISSCTRGADRRTIVFKKPVTFCVRWSKSVWSLAGDTSSEIARHGFLYFAVLSLTQNCVSCGKVRWAAGSW